MVLLLMNKKKKKKNYTKKKIKKKYNKLDNLLYEINKELKKIPKDKIENMKLFINKKNNRIRSGATNNDLANNDPNKKGDLDKKDDLKIKEKEYKNGVSRFFNSNFGKGVSIGAGLMVGLGAAGEILKLGGELGELIDLYQE